MKAAIQLLCLALVAAPALGIALRDPRYYAEQLPEPYRTKVLEAGDKFFGTINDPNFKENLIESIYEAAESAKEKAIEKAEEKIEQLSNLRESLANYADQLPEPYRTRVAEAGENFENVIKNIYEATESVKEKAGEKIEQLSILKDQAADVANEFLHKTAETVGSLDYYVNKLPEPMRTKVVEAGEKAEELLAAYSVPEFKEMLVETIYDAAESTKEKAEDVVSSVKEQLAERVADLQGLVELAKENFTKKSDSSNFSSDESEE